MLSTFWHKYNEQNLIVLILSLYVKISDKINIIDVFQKFCYNFIVIYIKKGEIKNYIYHYNFISIINMTL